MTTPDLSQLMPYGFTLAPVASRTFLDVLPNSNTHVVDTTGLRTPNGSFGIVVGSRMEGSIHMQITHTDGSPVDRRVIIRAGGGQYSTVLSGDNIAYIQFICTTNTQELAAGRRATVQIIPVSDPM